MSMRWCSFSATWGTSVALLCAIFSSPGLAQHEGAADAPPYALPETSGAAQSPINILTAAVRHADHRIALHYQPSHEHLLNLGHTIEAEFEAGSTLEYDGQVYELRQLHFHTPAEHLIDGITYPMEMHMVHTLQGNPEKYLVVGVLFREGAGNAFVEEVLAHVPGRSGERFDGPMLLDAQSEVERIDGYYHYEGSLTTPPYSESVTWLVLKDIHQAAPAQIEQLNRIEGDNARHIQALRARLVEAE
jgi:carbonic anhydrase